MTEVVLTEVLYLDDTYQLCDKYRLSTILLEVKLLSLSLATHHIKRDSCG